MEADRNKNSVGMIWKFWEADRVKADISEADIYEADHGGD